jgi:signal transduction histidine kinase
VNTGERREARAAAGRLAAQFAAIVVVLFAALGVVVYLVVSAGQHEAAQSTIQNASMVDSVHDAPRDLLVTVIEGGTRQSSPDMPHGLPDEAALSRVAAGGEPELSTVQADGQSFLTQTNVRHGKVVQISYGLREQAEELQRLVVALVVSGLLAAVAAAVLGVYFARRAMRPLADALALQRRFVADASHELRTPLTLLSTRAQLLRRRIRDASPAVDAEVRDGVDEIVDDSKALTEIVEDLLITADPRQSAEVDEVDLAAIAAAVGRSADAAADERGVRVVVESAGTARVSGAAVSLRRMVVALVDNAVDHARSRVVVAVTTEKGRVVLRVSDDGAGFAGEPDERVFERFASSRAEPDRAAQAGESGQAGQGRHYGLGLALVSEVVSRHRGVVEASNGGPAGGAVVTVHLPEAR